MACDLSFIVKSEGVLQITGTNVGYTSNVVLSRKQSYRSTHCNNRPWTGSIRPYMTYLIAAIAMTLGVRQGHSSTAIFFKLDVL